MNIQYLALASYPGRVRNSQHVECADMKCIRRERDANIRLSVLLFQLQTHKLRLMYFAVVATVVVLAGDTSVWHTTFAAALYFSQWVLLKRIEI